MKNKFISKLTAVLFIPALVITTFQSCTSEFEEINTDPYGISTESLQIDYNSVGAPFKQALQNIYAYSPAWVTQLQQNLIGDVYSGYMMPPTPFAGNSNNMTYDLVAGWNNFPWSWAYQNVMGPLRDMEREAGTDFPEFIAWGKVVRVEAMHRVSDIYGPIIYSGFGEIPSLYDCQENVYASFFEDLESAITELTPLASEPVSPFTSFDLVYGGDVTKWVQFANSLRLRLAIRVSKVDPALGKLQAEAAVNHPLGVMIENGGNFLVASAAGDTHPLNVMDNSWNDIRMGAPMESILGGYNDPRLPAYFLPSVTGGDFKGIRQGIAIAAKTDYQDVASALVDLGDVQLMTAAEVYFLRAEGALRGWNMGGSAQSLYEQGIQTSFDQYGLGDASGYFTNSTNTAMAYVDPVNNSNSISLGSSNLSTSTIQWNAGDALETNLERIITQKWIAMYPDGQEAWSEFRRTGYPVLFPVVVNNSAGKINTDDFIKRINFTADEFSTNPQGVTSGENCLNGADTGGTALWWDID